LRTGEDRLYPGILAQESLCRILDVDFVELNKRFVLDLAEDWQRHGREVFKRVRRESPAAYLKVCAMLVPREMKVEHSNAIKDLTDEQLERSIELIKDMIAERDAGASRRLHAAHLRNRLLSVLTEIGKSAQLGRPRLLNAVLQGSASCYL
jgi:hypothetical protein